MRPETCAVRRRVGLAAASAPDSAQLASPAGSGLQRFLFLWWLGFFTWVLLAFGVAGCAAEHAQISFSCAKDP